MKDFLLYRSGRSFKSAGLFLLRLGIGLTFIFIHGGPKLLGGPEEWVYFGKTMSIFGLDFYPTFWGFMAAMSEGLGGVLVLLGLFTRPATIFLLGTMSVAMIKHIHNGDPITYVSYPLELGILFVSLFVLGPGRYSLDQMFFGRS